MLEECSLMTSPEFDQSIPMKSPKLQHHSSIVYYIINDIFLDLSPNKNNDHQEPLLLNQCSQKLAVILQRFDFSGHLRFQLVRRVTVNSK